MKVVSNASPLIFLAKIGKLDLLNRYEVSIPQQVYEEVIKGIESRDDAQEIKSLVERKIIRVEKTEITKELNQQNLGNGEKAAISLAANKNIKQILLDEKKARRIAKLNNLEPLGTIGVLIEAQKNNEISKKELIEFTRKLIKNRYRINEALIIKLLEETEQ